MLYRKLSKTGIDLSVLGFGCMRLPTIDNRPEKIDYPQAIRLLHHAIDNGVNYVDTAYFYHAAVFGQRGESEPFVGEALSGGWRKKVNLATKMPLFQLNQREQMDAFLKEQLERLKTDYLDFIFCMALTAKRGTGCAILAYASFSTKRRPKDRQVSRFFISWKGRGFHPDLRRIRLGLCEIQYNYMDVNFQAGLKGLTYAADKGIGVVVMEPLKGGKLAQKLPPEMTAVFAASKVKSHPRRVGASLCVERTRRIKRSVGHEHHGTGRGKHPLRG